MAGDFRVPASLLRALAASAEADREHGSWVVTYNDPTGERAVWNVLVNPDLDA